MGLSKVTRGQYVPDDINVIIEIAAQSTPVKYEIDKETGAIFVDRFISTYMRYPCNYGYIPHTLSEDGDPLDVLVVTPLPVNWGCVIRCRPIGMLIMSDEKGVDLKIIAVPHSSITPLYLNVAEVSDLEPLLLKQISHFFTHYKDLEDGKWVTIDGWSDAAKAKAAILDCIKRYDSAEEPPPF